MTTTGEGDEAFLQPGDFFAGYQVTQQLGAGAFGTVYEAVKVDTGQRVALKVLNVSLQSHPEVARRFERETRAVQRFKHPNIVSAIEVDVCDGVQFLAMERLDGETLTELMRREKRLPLSRALDVALPLMAAVRSVHAQNIVHRDLKPDNVFLARLDDGRVQPKILDFGFAKMAEPGLRLTGKDTAIGTPNFMSPEQMLTPRDVDPRSDQWALGVMLYFMLTGVKPFESKNLADVLKNVLQREPVPLRELAPEVPVEVAEAIHRTMRKRPEDRFPAVHDFAQTLVGFARDDVALRYAADFFTVEVWENLSEEAPPRTAAEGRQRTRASRAPRLSPPPRGARASTPPN